MPVPWAGLSRKEANIREKVLTIAVDSLIHATLGCGGPFIKLCRTGSWVVRGVKVDFLVGMG